MTTRVAAIAVAVLCVLLEVPAYGADVPVEGGVYLDLGYLGSNNQPDNRAWRSKGTSAYLDRIEFNNATAFLRKEVAEDSPWGFELGVQGGNDVDKLVSAAAASSAEWQRHLHNTNLAYRFPVGDGLTLRGGIIPGHLGYESFQGIDNPNYTRVYSGDLVPYYHWGLNTAYQHSDAFSATLLVVNGFDYLAAPNNAVSFGPQVQWIVTESLWLRQNFYLGPEQSQTAFEFWRFATETVGELRFGDVLLAAVFGYGTEKQSIVPNRPDFVWTWGAAYAQWTPGERWRFAVRPEFLNDADGLASGIRQSIGAATGTVEYRMSPLEKDVLSVRLEYRFDRSTGVDGGYYQGSGNALTRDQHLFIAAVMWRFDSGS